MGRVGLWGQFVSFILTFAVGCDLFLLELGDADVCRVAKEEVEKRFDALQKGEGDKYQDMLVRLGGKGEDGPELTE